MYLFTTTIKLTQAQNLKLVLCIWSVFKGNLLNVSAPLDSETCEFKAPSILETGFR
jgi:hypothetical protein